MQNGDVGGFRAHVAAGKSALSRTRLYPLYLRFFRPHCAEVEIELNPSLIILNSCGSFSPRAQSHPRASCRGGGLGPPASCSKRCQTSARDGARPTSYPSLRGPADGARKLPAELAAVPSPRP